MKEFWNGKESEKEIAGIYSPYQSFYEEMEKITFFDKGVAIHQLASQALQKSDFVFKRKNRH
ncbi:MAG: hypothetical protein U5L98_17125 [Halomonas sp.]|uniref:hypothetical protein n=1 Tax=Halomonas sp. TaxID=1486246 RepID=UPI002ACD5F7D|nr:hypothetical protein [Halomonas sp.]MDZ7854299.1 hypothetical protein [Halomonas sp.]